jgi:hypothetical protein
MQMIRKKQRKFFEKEFERAKKMVQNSAVTVGVM